MLASAFAEPRKSGMGKDACWESVSSGAANEAGGESNQIGEAKSIAIWKFTVHASTREVNFP
jgi:hypothetical protein